MQERRNSIRHGLRWKTIVHGNDSKGANFDEIGVIENLSSTGAFFYISRRVPVGSQLDLAIQLPFKKESWMNYSARVIRIEEQPSNSGLRVANEESNGGKIGIAIRFNNIKPIFTSR